jgi:predicted anti-sigma-YlaC factor YlaD
MTRAVDREPTCQELAELLTDYLEGLLTPEQHALFDLHISGCRDCTLYVEQMRTTIVVVGRVTAEDIPPVVRDELLAAFRGWAAGF